MNKTSRKILLVFSLIIAMFIYQGCFLNESTILDDGTGGEKKANIEIFDEYKAKFVDSYKIIEFGNYYKDNDSDLMPMEWIILKEKEGKKLLLSLYCFDCMPYHEKYDNMSHWNISSIRQRLNEDFYNIAFNDDEKMLIEKSEYIPKINPITRKGNASKTLDYVFLLSFDTCEELLNTDILKQAEPTEYARMKGCWKFKNGMCNYWLMEKGAQTCDSIFVDNEGVIQYRGDGVNDALLGVRACIWVRDEN